MNKQQPPEEKPDEELGLLKRTFSNLGLPELAGAIGFVLSQLGYPLLGGALSQARVSLLARELRAKIKEIRNTAVTADELQDLLARTLRATISANDEQHVRLLAAGLSGVFGTELLPFPDAARLLRSLEELDSIDVATLRRIGAVGRAKVGDLLADLDKDWNTHSPPDDPAFSMLHTSTQKLLSRGLAVQDSMHGTISRRYEGDPNSWVTSVLNSGLSITPRGRELLALLAAGQA